MIDDTKAILAGRRANVYNDGTLYWLHIRMKSGKSLVRSFQTLKAAREEYKYAEMGFVDGELFSAPCTQSGQANLFGA